MLPDSHINFVGLRRRLSVSAYAPKFHCMAGMDESIVLMPAMALLLEESQEHTRAIHTSRDRFNLMAQSYSTGAFHFCFKKNEIQQLKVLLEIPDPIITPQHYNASAEEASASC
ncbi:hypothetical protein DYB36_012318 [Aphanomyces astaci]|uniref:Uncharacterized protein n=1 Tax=Aphanomyces astaci TaxID=112090 RepID=A0A397BU98_APHAT|nr:hypothetical protein DYB36_012318 [Aphanomyces astaci]